MQDDIKRFELYSYLYTKQKRHVVYRTLWSFVQGRNRGRIKEIRIPPFDKLVKNELLEWILNSFFD